MYAPLLTDVPSGSPAASSSTGPRTLSGAAAEPLPSNWGSQPATGSSARKAGGGFSAGGGRGGIATLRDLGAGGGGGGDDDDPGEGEDEGEDRGPANFFTGGERSGLSVQNPDHKKKKDQPDVVRNILQQAAKATKDRGDQEENTLGATGPSFGGKGRRIGDDSAAENATAGGSNSEKEEEEDEVAIRHLTFWQDGFSIEDGPLHRYDDPASQELLEQIRSERAPLSLFNIRFDQRVQIRVAQRVREKYQPPAPGPMKAFGGEGNRLGAPAPAASAPTSAPATTSSTAAAALAPSDFKVDDSKPTTQVQIRLGDGSRMVGRFNEDHTVADVRRYVNAAHPGMASRSYVLQASFPPKPLTDEEATLKQAGLVGAVVIQKFT